MCNYKRLSLFGELSLDGSAFGFVSGLVEQRKHVFLVSFNARLVERVHLEDVSAHSASFLEEVDEFAAAFLADFGHGDNHGRHTAVDVSQSGIIGVIGTRATIASDCYRRAIANLSPTARVYAQPCPLFVPLVEEGWVDTLPARIIVKTYIGEFLKSMNLMQEGDFCVKNYSEKKKENGIIDTLILGCTHYPVLRDAIDMALNDYGVEVTLCDCGVATARALECALREGEMMHTRRELGSTSYLVTDDPELFTSIGRSFMKQPPVNVEHIDIL